jgi:hypothetical protein
VGLVYDDEGATVIDPDEEVAAAVTEVFAAFRAGGSAYQAVAAFKGRRFPLRAYGGVWAGELRWGRLAHSRVLGILANPAYAGTYVFGRYRSRRLVSPDGSVRTKITQLPRAEWPVVIHDHHDGYITWDDYLANEARLAANTTNAGARPPREGVALCQGIIVCGSCGRPMTTRYHRTGRPAYECSASRADQMATPTCRSVAAATVDDAVGERVLEALTPEEVATALAAADEVSDRRTRSGRAGELAVERARYEAERAERAFLATEPENRLVARSLEARWETRLSALADAEEALARARAVLAPLPSRSEVEALVADLPRLWHASTTSARDRKRLLRTLVADVTLLSEADLAKCRIGIRWHSGATDEVVVARRLAVVEYRRTEPGAIELVRRLSASLSNEALATELNAAGFLTGAGRAFDSRAVCSLRHYHKIPAPPLLGEGEATVAEVAKHLGVSTGAVTHWITRGHLSARRGHHNRWCIPFGPDVEQACRQRVAASAHIPRVETSHAPSPDERTVGQVAVELGISTNVVYYWIEHSQVDARRSPGGRWLVSFSADEQSACRRRVAASVRLKLVGDPQTQSTTSGEAV